MWWQVSTGVLPNGTRVGSIAPFFCSISEWKYWRTQNRLEFGKRGTCYTCDFMISRHNLPEDDTKRRFRASSPLPHTPVDALLIKDSVTPPRPPYLATFWLRCTFSRRFPQCSRQQLEHYPSPAFIYYGRQNNYRHPWPPTDVLTLISRNCEYVTLHSKRDFEGVIRWRPWR